MTREGEKRWQGRTHSETNTKRAEDEGGGSHTRKEMRKASRKD